MEAYSSFLAREPQLQDLRLFFDAPPDLKRTIVSRYLPGNGLQHYTDLFDLVINRNNELILTYPLNRFLEADLSYKGGYINRIAPGVTPREFAGFRAGKSASTPNREQLLALAKIISLARRSGIRLLFVESPLPAPVSANGGIQALKAIFSSTLREQNIPYIDGDKGFPIQEPQLFSDGNHLSSDGRARFTAYLARILNQQTLN